MPYDPASGREERKEDKEGGRSGKGRGGACKEGRGYVATKVFSSSLDPRLTPGHCDQTLQGILPLTSYNSTGCGSPTDLYRLPSGLRVDVTCTRTSRFRLRFGRSQGLGAMCCRARCLRRGKNIQTLHIRVSSPEMWWQQEQWLHTTGWRVQRTAPLWLGRSPRKHCKNDLDDQP